ncbi:BatD family protein [Thermococcus sp.]|uniref:BatD family protein n=1 Tax=Thermococcus sp. TaxID=35749 RepID=UPI002616BC89|nr:BatD family protein [Thermococcus sp.]
MKKQTALLLMAFLVLQSVAIQGTSATTIKYATISVTLGLKDSAILGPYNITFADASIQWDSVVITIKGPSGSYSNPLKAGETMYYPSSSPGKIMIAVKVLWIYKDTQSVLLSIESPLAPVYSNKTMVVGSQLQLPEGFPQMLIELEASSNSQAVFKVTTPYKEQYTLTISKDATRVVSYRLDPKHVYSNYLAIEVVNCSKNEAKINVYLPKVASVNFKVVRWKKSKGNPAPTVSTTLIYSDIIYVGERLPVTYNKTTYYFELLSVIPDVVKMKVYKGNESVGTYTLSVGDIPKTADGTPFMLAVQKTDPDYKRAIIRIYGPIESEVTPILRPAKVVANITAVPRQVLLGQDIVLSIGVENLGRGNAYQLNVAAPIPNGFELISMTKSWQIKNLPAFTKLPMLVYVLRPTKVGKFTVGKVIVTYYDDQSLETGKMKTIYSAPLGGIVVYNTPEMSVTGSAYNGTWSNYVTAKVNGTVKLKVTVTASKGDPNYEFVKNATLYLELPKGLSGPSLLKVGDIKAGESKSVTVDLKVTREALLNVRATLVYQDPLGNEHKLSTGNLVSINSIPPEVVVKKVKVWPKPSELPAYLNKTLSGMDNPTPLAQQVEEIASHYLPPKSNPWKPTAVLFILTTIVLAGLTYNYYSQLEKLREKVLRKKQRRPGGLPKKEEEETEL